MADARPVPEGFRTITPQLTVADAGEAIAFYQRAFGAEEILRMPAPGGGIMHVELRIGDSTLMLTEERPDAGVLGPRSIGGSPVSIHLYVKDADAAFERAVNAGATVRTALHDAFWGDRYGSLEDPFGHRWSIATHVVDLTPEEVLEGAKKAFGEG